MARSPFLWGQGGRKMTPDQVDRERLVAQALMAQASDTSPVGHWTAALNRALQGVTGGIRQRRAGRAEDEGLAAAAERVAPYLGGSPTVTASSMGGASPVAAALAGGDFIDPAAGGVNFPASLIASESGGNWNALNSEGYGGRLQFGQERLADAARAGVIPMGLTGADFSRMSPEEQMAVEQWHFADIDRQAQAMGLYDYLGQNIGGVTITPDAIRGMAHLGGIGGAAKFIKSGGAYNPSDSNGTSLRDYGIAHGSGGGVTASTMGGSPVASALMSGPSSQELLGLMADPWVARQYGPVLQALAGNAASREQAIFAQQLAQSDPMYQAELAKLTAPAASPTAEREAFALAGGLVPGTPEYGHYMLTGEMPATAQPIEVGGVLLDPVTMEPVFDSRTPSDGPTSVQEYTFYADQVAEAGGQPVPYDEWYNAREAAGASKTSVSVGGEGLTPGWKKIDESFADTYIDWVGGGWADNAKQIDQLGEALSIIDSGKDITGAIGLLPGSVQAFVNPDGTIAREAVEEVVQRSLREILGAQFTEKEGERLIARAYNPLLPPAENRKRVGRLLEQIKAMGVSRQEMVDYFNENGTLRGYTGKKPSVADLEGLMEDEGAPAAAPAPAGDKPRKRYNPATGAFE